MLSPELFLDGFIDAGCKFYVGVPDSLLIEFCRAVESRPRGIKHVIAANEGGAIGLAAGSYLASSNVPIVYMQNSGIGNAINPLLSLADGEIYSIPMVVVVGWRGESGVPDEPQHVKQGRVTLEIFDAIKIPYYVVDGLNDCDIDIPKLAIARAKITQGPVAIVIKKNSFNKFQSNSLLVKKGDNDHILNREAAIASLLRAISSDALVVATTGHISREIYELRDKSGVNHDHDFLTVGSMGHASQIALGIALEADHRKVFCIDGDGSALMHMGGLATVGASGCKNMIHIVLNNGAHGSVGGQKTVAMDVNLTAIAQACGYQTINRKVYMADQISNALQELSGLEGAKFLEIIVGTGFRDNLGRPTQSPLENKLAFMKNL